MQTQLQSVRNAKLQVSHKMQNCNKCNCPVNWDKLIDKTYTKKDGTQGHGWWREDLSKEEHTKTRCENFAKSGEFGKTAPKTETPKANYGKIPDWLLNDSQVIKEAWRGYASVSAELVDEVQPNLDSRTRAMAVSAVLDQLIQLQHIKAIKESKD